MSYYYDETAGLSDFTGLGAAKVAGARAAQMRANQAARVQKMKAARAAHPRHLGDFFAGFGALGAYTCPAGGGARQNENKATAYCKTQGMLSTVASCNPFQWYCDPSKPTKVTKSKAAAPAGQIAPGSAPIVTSPQAFVTQQPVGSPYPAAAVTPTQPPPTYAGSQAGQYDPTGQWVWNGAQWTPSGTAGSTGGAQPIITPAATGTWWCKAGGGIRQQQQKAQAYCKQFGQGATGVSCSPFQWYCDPTKSVRAAGSNKVAPAGMIGGPVSGTIGTSGTPPPYAGSPGQQVSYNGVLWVWNINTATGTYGWINSNSVSGTGTPPPYSGSTVGQTVYYNGVNWTWSGVSWTNASLGGQQGCQGTPPLTPGSYVGQVMQGQQLAYGAAPGSTLYSGYAACSYTWNGYSWVQSNAGVTTTPPPYPGTYSGQTTQYNGATFSWNGYSWIQTSGTATPPPYVGQFVGQVLQYGGYSWTWSGAQWTQVGGAVAAPCVSGGSIDPNTGQCSNPYEYQQGYPSQYPGVYSPYGGGGPLLTPIDDGGGSADTGDDSAMMEQGAVNAMTPYSPGGGGAAAPVQSALAMACAQEQAGVLMSDQYGTFTPVQIVCGAVAAPVAQGQGGVQDVSAIDSSEISSMQGMRGFRGMGRFVR